MPPENKNEEQKELSFIEKARRAQIVESAIDTIASLGYAQASLAQIAKRAGISKGVISYHFAGKEELIKQVVTEVFAVGTAFMLPQIEAESSAWSMLRAYIKSNLAFMQTHRKHIVSLLEIASNFRPKDRTPPPITTKNETAVNDLERLLKWGQETGEFRPFSTQMMATVIRSAIDVAPQKMANEEGFDLDTYAEELVSLFERAICR